MVEAGAVGVDLEDGTDDPDAPLVGVDEHAAKIRAAREAADDAGVPIVINGRTDVFWRAVGDEASRVSVGSGPMRATLGRLRAIGEELRDEGSYRGMADTVPYGDLNSLRQASLDRRNA